LSITVFNGEQLTESITQLLYSRHIPSAFTARYWQLNLYLRKFERQLTTSTCVTKLKAFLYYCNWKNTTEIAHIVLIVETCPERLPVTVATSMQITMTLLCFVIDRYQV